MTRWARWYLASVFLVLVPAGCGERRPFVSPLHVTERGPMVFRHLAEPPSSAAGVGPANLVFFDTRHGFVATTGGAGWMPKVGFQPPRDRGRIERTDDGGRSWRTVGSARNVVFDQSLPLAFSGGTAWAADPLRGELWRTTNWSRTWSISVRPAELAPSALLVATRTMLAVDASETLVSRDGGRSWHTSKPLTALEVAHAQHALAFIQPTRESALAVAYLATERGWRPLAATHDGRQRFSGDVAFADSSRGLLAPGQFWGGVGNGETPVFSTEDAGRTWRRVRLPAGVPSDSYVSLGPDAIVLPEPFVSVDAGRHWLRFRGLPQFARCGVSRADRSVWILCSADAADRGPDVLLRTTDGGSTWSWWTAREGLDPHIVAVGETEAWALTRTRGCGDARSGTRPTAAAAGSRCGSTCRRSLPLIACKGRGDRSHTWTPNGDFARGRRQREGRCRSI